jgi:spore coat polysaccharide biosynthesis protein SpsF
VKTLVVIQASTGSIRLPGKVLLPLAGAPMLQRMIERVAAAETPISITVAATASPADDPIVEIARRAGVDCFRGHPTDLLDRHYRAAIAARADVVVKIPSNCPLIDPRVIDRVLGVFHEEPGHYDFVSNLHPPTYPEGNDVEVMTTDALGQAFREARSALDREHTTPFLWEHPERFRTGSVVWEKGRDYSMLHRFTLDYPGDYAFVRAVYDRLWTPQRPLFALDDILALLVARPAIFALNHEHAGVSRYLRDLGEPRSERTAARRAPATSP